jgi:ribosome-associated translation inhibitor RaiA
VMDVAVTAMGLVADEHKNRTRERIARLEQRVGEPVLGARVVLNRERNPCLERPARAEAELNVNGHMVRARVAAGSMPEAVDTLSHHIEHQLHGFSDRRAQLARRAPRPSLGEWHHGAWSPPRPSYFLPRPRGSVPLPTASWSTSESTAASSTTRRRRAWPSA